MTLEEWADLPEDVEGELVDGFLVEEEVSDLVHDVVIAWLIHKLYGWAEPHAGIVAASDAKFAVGERTGRKPDLSLFLPDPLPPRGALVRVPPYIAVEVVSPSARDRRCDRVEKRAEYASFGIAWYWIVDERARTVEILRLEDGAYVTALSAAGGVERDVPGCDGLTLDLDDLWAQVDRLR